MVTVVRREMHLALGQERTIIETGLSVAISDEENDAAKRFELRGIVEVAVKGWDSKTISSIVQSWSISFSPTKIYSQTIKDYLGPKFEY
ncbi:unnamed protein product [Phytophthora fragariaefolia]|uniref:Unnamed protein product n=1 Tax=Phytophthora fragariaefolia TaxID=1490495 RepID=A0A9W6YDK9_9STRA|nr:unnamed protein product [Phytophthora fragariaefolia]